MSSKGKKLCDSAADQLSSRVADISLHSHQDTGWEVYGGKTKKKGGSSAGKPSAPHNPSYKAWGDPDVVQKLGMRSSTASEPAVSWPKWTTDSRGPDGRGKATSQFSNQVADGNQMSAVPVAPATSKHASNWSARVVSTEFSEHIAGSNQNFQKIEPVSVGYPNSDGVDNSDEEDGSDIDYDFDDDMLSDEFDSDSSTKSHETKKKNRWFRKLFQCMDKLTADQINDPERRWHCPACKGGPGAIDWYKGLPPLISHARTKGSSRVKLHRELAQLLEVELQIRGTSAIPAGETFGKWTGPDEVTEKAIVWPPIVIIMNTRLERDMNEKWTGMGNEELRSYFSLYNPDKARHSYGPQGHRGISLLIFESTAVGYLQAERLSKDFAKAGKGREAWDLKRVPFNPGGKRPLYGYLAEQRDLEDFNQHSKGKQKLKYEIKSYIETVVNQLNQMGEENLKLNWFKDKFANEQRHSKALEESYGFLTEKLKKTEEDNRIVRLKTKMYHEQSKEEMDCQEDFFSEQIKAMYDARVAREDSFEKSQQDKRDEMTQSPNVSSVEGPSHRVEEIEKFIKLQDIEMDEFVSERDKLLKEHTEEMVALKRRHWEETIALETKLDAQLNKLMESYMLENKEPAGKSTCK